MYISDDKSQKKLKKNFLTLDNNKLDRVSIINRIQNTNYPRNFLNTLKEIPNKYNYYSFSDQDDIWIENKLEKAIEKINKYPTNTPVMYCGRSIIQYQNSKDKRKLSKLYLKSPSFQNALVQNMGGGNTMVLNKAARDLVVSSLSNQEISSHDWWIYQILTGAGGIVVYDQAPYIYYRQHGLNIMSTNNDWRGRLSRIKGLFHGKYKNWNTLNINALKKNYRLITSENKITLDFFIKARKGNLLKRLYYLKLSKVHRQDLLGNLGIIFAALINKI